MGRTKPAIPAGNFWLRPSTNQKGETPVYVRYYVQGKYIKKSTNVFVNPSDWDNKKQEVKSRNRQAIPRPGPVPIKAAKAESASAPSTKNRGLKTRSAKKPAQLKARIDPVKVSVEISAQARPRLF